MNKLYTVMVAALVLVCTNMAKADPAGTYTDALRTCGAEWRASDQRKQVEKGHGQEAWNKFRAECVARVGYTSKKRGVIGGPAKTEG